MERITAADAMARTFTETGDQINRNLQGIGSILRPSRAYWVVRGVTQSNPLIVTIAPAAPTIGFTSVDPAPHLAWGHTYTYRLTVLSPSGQETPASLPSVITIPPLAPAPVVTVETGAGAAISVDLLYGLCRVVGTTAGGAVQTPIGVLAFAGATPAAPGPRNVRLSMPPGDEREPMSWPGLTADTFQLYRANNPPAGNAIDWVGTGGLIGYLHRGDSLLDRNTFAYTAVAPPTAGGPRVTLSFPATGVPGYVYRVYGRDADAMGLLATMPADVLTSWVDNGSRVPAPVAPPRFSTMVQVPTAIAYAPRENSHEPPFTSRTIRITAYDAALVAQLSPTGEGQWLDELDVPAPSASGPGVRELDYTGKRIRIRTADAGGVDQTRYQIEVWD